VPTVPIERGQWIGAVSHWALDWITHRADMPGYPSGPKYGLRPYDWISGTMIADLALLIGGVWLYAQCTRGRDRIGPFGYWAYIAVLLIRFIADGFSDPPKSMKEVATTGLVATRITLDWPGWFDRHREPVIALVSGRPC
jgi:hypothetical protein